MTIINIEEIKEDLLHYAAGEIKRPSLYDDIADDFALAAKDVMAEIEAPGDDTDALDKTIDNAALDLAYKLNDVAVMNGDSIIFNGAEYAPMEGTDWECIENGCWRYFADKEESAILKVTCPEISFEGDPEDDLREFCDRYDWEHPSSIVVIE